MDSKKKWNSKHADRIEQQKQKEPNPRLIKLAPYFTGGTAVDLACGLGANSVFLAKLNYKVSAVDISDVAVSHVKELADKENLAIDAFTRDLTNLKQSDMEENSADLAVITYYLDRLIFPYIKSIIKKNGFIFIETYYVSPAGNSKVSDNYKLQPGELLSEFKNWHILFYEENEHEGRQTILARKV
ncbi:methyltransferase domain-containing protein [Salipaludibacillus sp. CUR1]|uniref:methyltransferase domain-containing protein n=1 Tax=Salipaludibacillus sp. CUR1 TaxID=2820003 RepID=UPI001E44D84D|nr:methyltransferase domain-containing protein [Salipaludibacillus sp. CUR1]MCE7791240.1 methyltransferase domain-containing protein [Salipaludibacillus sp. CUR1]